MAEHESLTVYIVDDHELVRAGLRALVQAAGHTVVGEAGTVDDAVKGIIQCHPAVAILDIRLADGSGVDVCRQVSQQSPQTACLMLTSYNDDDALFDSIDAGAMGYLIKRVRNLELMEAIRRIANGERVLDADATARVLDRIRFGRQHDPRLDGLTISERAVLKLIGEGLSNREISERLTLAEKTVKNYVSKVLHTLGMRSRTQAALYLAANPGLRDRSAVCF